jgi:hypothetical protein
VLICEQQPILRFRSAPLNISIKTDLASPLPIGCIVGVYSRTGTHRAEENMLRRIDHNSYMPAPNHQVARLRPCHADKFIRADIEIRRTHVRIRKAGANIDTLYKMRAVAP